MIIFISILNITPSLRAKRSNLTINKRLLRSFLPRNDGAYLKFLKLPLIFIFCLLLLFSFSATAQNNAAKKDTVWIRDTVQKIIEKEVKEDKSEKNFEKSLNVLDSAMGVFGNSLAIFTIVITLIGAVFGFIGWKEVRELKSIKEAVREKIDKSNKDMRQIESDAKIVNGLKEQLIKETDKLKKDIDINKTKISSKEKPSEDAQKKLDELASRLDFLETLGVSLKPQDYVQRGNDFFYKKQFDFAIEAYEEAIALDPKFSTAWYNIACAYSSKNEKENALINLKQSVELDIKHKEEAKTDNDFKNLWDDEDFKRITL